MFHPEQPRPSIPRRACPRRLDRKIPRLAARKIRVQGTKMQIPWYTSQVYAPVVHVHNTTIVAAEGRGRKRWLPLPSPLPSSKCCLVTRFSAVDRKADVVPF